MLRWIIFFSLLLTAFALDLEKYNNVPPQDVPVEELGELLEDLYNSKSRERDLEEYEMFMLEDAETERERQLVNSWIMYIRAAIIGRDEALEQQKDEEFPPEITFEELQKRTKQLPALLRQQWYTDNFESQKKKKMDKSDDILSSENQKVHKSDEYNSKEQKNPTKIKETVEDSIWNIDDDDEEDESFEDFMKKYEILDEFETGRQYRLGRVNKEDIEKERDIIYLNYYHALYPNEEKPLVRTEEIDRKIENALKDGSTMQKAAANKKFKDDINAIELDIKKEYLHEEITEEEKEYARKKWDITQITEEDIKKMQTALKGVAKQLKKIMKEAGKEMPPLKNMKTPEKKTKVEKTMESTNDNDDLTKKYEKHFEMGKNKTKDQHNTRQKNSQQSKDQKTNKYGDKYDVVIEQEHLARSLEQTERPVKRKIQNRRYRLVKLETEDEIKEEKQEALLQFYFNVYPDDPVPHEITPAFAKKMMAKLEAAKLSEDQSVQSAIRVLKKSIQMIDLGYKKVYPSVDEPMDGLELWEQVWEWDAEDLEKRYQEHLKNKKSKKQEL